MVIADTGNKFLPPMLGVTHYIQPQGGARCSLLQMLFFLNAAILAGPVNPGAGEAPPGSDGVTTIVKWIAWIVFALAVIGVLVTAGAMMINNRRGQGGEHAASLGWVFGGCILASAASGLVGMFMG